MKANISTTEEWKQTHFGAVADIFTGKKDVNETVANGEYIFFSCSPETFRSSEYICDNKAIIIVGNGSYAGTVRYFDGKFDLYQRTYGCTLKKEQQDDFDIKFLFYYLKKYFEKDFIGGSRGSSIPYIVRGDIENFEIPNPPIEEQRRIACVLSTLDDKIELLRQQNETLEQIAKNLFTEWFVKPTTGTLPSGWRVGTLGEEFQIIMGQSPKGETFNEAKDGMVFFQGRTDFQWRFPKTRLYTTAPTRVAEPTDVLVSVRAPVGDINVALERCCIGRGLAAIRGSAKSYTLYKVLSLQEPIRAFDAEGTVFGSVSKTDLANVAVNIPPVELVGRFERATSSFDGQILNNSRQIDMLSNVRDILLQKLMSGEIQTK